jgi:hypothetical protein
LKNSFVKVIYCHPIISSGRANFKLKKRYRSDRGKIEDVVPIDFQELESSRFFLASHPAIRVKENSFSGREGDHLRITQRGSGVVDKPEEKPGNDQTDAQGS